MYATLEKYKDYLINIKKISKNTITAYNRDINKLIESVFGNPHIDGIVINKF